MDIDKTLGGIGCATDGKKQRADREKTTIIKKDKVE